MEVMDLDPDRASAEDLVDLYLRLRDEFDGGERNLDPNQKIRASIVMAVSSAAEASGSDLKAIERKVRDTHLGQLQPALAA